MTTAPKRPPLPVITDHALIRWLERVHGIDMEGFRDKLQAVVAPYVALGAHRVIIENFAYEFDGVRLTTVQPPKHGKNRRRTATLRRRESQAA